jgi:hypothetical protein
MNEGHPVQALWCDPADGVIARIVRALAERELHAARTVVLVPYAQLMGVARAMWTRCGSAGFVPRFETTHNWARSAGGFVPTGYDIAHDMARDLVTAQALLSQAGFHAERFAMAGRVVELAYQLAPLAAAVTPEERVGDWALRAAGVAEAGSESEWFRMESALIRIAVAWVSTSGYATDVLMRASTRAQVDALIVLEGFQTDPLTQSLFGIWGGDALRFSLVPAGAAPAPAASHVALDPEDEAQLAAACVLRHLGEERAPVALIATDRALTRRISAQLAAQGIVTHDETGWKLSTTRAAATLMTALRACAHDASSDQVLEWLKGGADGDAPAVQSLEARLRREGLRDWSVWCALVARSEKPQDVALLPFTEAIEARRMPMARSRPLAEWLGALRELLEAGGQWQLLVDDFAGGKVIGALWLDAGAHGDDDEFPGGRHTLAEFTAWARDVLEDASFVPPAGDQAPRVVVLPLYQLLGRAFGAVVIPGCDDRRLPASPEPPGNWSAAQRQELGLPLRETLEAAQRAAWAAALHLGQRLRGPAPLPVPLLRAAPAGLHEASEIDVEVDKRDFGNWLHAVLRDFHRELLADPQADRVGLARPMRRSCHAQRRPGRWRVPAVRRHLAAGACRLPGLAGEARGLRRHLRHGGNRARNPAGQPAAGRPHRSHRPAGRRAPSGHRLQDRGAAGEQGPREGCPTRTPSWPSTPRCWKTTPGRRLRQRRRARRDPEGRADRRGAGPRCPGGRHRRRLQRIAPARRLPAAGRRARLRVLRRARPVPPGCLACESCADGLAYEIDGARVAPKRSMPSPAIRAAASPWRRVPARARPGCWCRASCARCSTERAARDPGHHLHAQGGRRDAPAPAALAGSVLAGAGRAGGRTAAARRRRRPTPKPCRPACSRCTRACWPAAGRCRSAPSTAGSPRCCAMRRWPR